MFFECRRAWVVACLLLLSSLNASAAVEAWSGAPFSADPKALLAASATVPRGESEVMVLLDEAHYTFDDKGGVTTVQRIVYRIDGESAIESWSTASAQWAPWFEEKPVIEARVITADGTVRKLDANVLTEAPAPTSLEIFSDNREIRAPLPNIAVGCVIEEVTTRRQKRTVLDAGMNDIFHFGGYFPRHRARLIIDSPASLPLRFVNQTSPQIEPSKEEKDGVQHIVFEGGDFTPREDYEWGLPYDVSQLPYVAFSSGPSWQEIARRYAEVVDAQIAAGKPRGADIVGASTNRSDIIGRALAYIQKNVRYAGVELAESSIVPRTPDSVVANRYGDCKDKATLLVALLRGAGVNADVALLRSGSDLDVRADLPGVARFNHAIVLVRGTPATWIDPTDDFARPGELPAPDRGRMALVANATTTALVQTPFSSPTENGITETRVFTLSEEGKAAVSETTEAVGAAEASLRRYAATTDVKSYREGLESYAKDTYLAKALKSYDTSDPHDLSKPFRLHLEITEAQRGITEDGEAVVAIFPTALLDELPESLRYDPAKDADNPKKNKKRENDFLFRPSMAEWRYRLVPPPGYVPRELPQNETTKLGSATVIEEFSAEKDGSVAAVFRFDSGKRRLSPAEFEETRKAVVEFLGRPAVMLGFEQVGLQKLQAGDVGGALAEYRRLAKQHPKEARHRVEIARALLTGGLAEAARAEVRKAIAIEPTYAGAQRALGTIMEHDLLGRQFHSGCDLVAARAAYKRAKELAPKDATIRGEYATLLEIGDSGLTFGEGAPVEDAIVEYTALVDELDQPRYAGRLLLSLAHAGKFKEMKERANKTSNEVQRRWGLLVAIGATEGSAAALRESNTYDQSARKSALREAAGTLLVLRMYPAAIAMLEAANGGAPTAEQRAQLDILKKARRVETMQFPDDDPKSVVRRMLTVLFTKKLAPAVMAPFFTDEMKAALAADRDEEWATAQRGLLKLARSQSVPLVFYADVGIPAAQFAQDGDDTTGYAVRVRGAGMTGKETYFVVKEGTQYRIAASVQSASTIGATVLRMLSANETGSAKQWLNWAREEIGARDGDDDVDGSPFASLWEKGTQTATVDQMRLAAATLMLDKNSADRSIDILGEARKSAGPEQQVHIDHAIVLALLAKEKFEEILPVALRLKAARPKSQRAFAILLSTYRSLGRFADMEQLANERLAAIPKDQAALRALGSTAISRGDYATAEKYYARIIAELTPTSNDYNEIAWNALVGARDLSAALDNARQGLSPNGTGSPALMHTVAAIYAEVGKSMEARDALLRSIDIAGREEPSESDWYVLGRIAENYGATDAAIAAYRRVTKPKIVDGASTWVLASRRMSALGAK